MIRKVFLRRFSSIKDGSSAFGAKESAQENKFIHDHEVETLAKLKSDLAAREASWTKREAVPKSQEKSPISPIDLAPGSQGVSSGFGRKEAAVEEKWIRDHDKEKLAHLKEDLAKPKKH